MAKDNELSWLVATSLLQYLEIQFWKKNEKFLGNLYTDMFNLVINSYELRDLPLIGEKYMWSNNQQDPTIEKLDRILINFWWLG